MNDNKRPTFLDGYKVFDELDKWVTQNIHERKGWTVNSFKLGQSSAVRCRLEWSMEGQMAWIDQVAITPEEAVYLALSEFTQWEQSK